MIPENVKIQIDAIAERCRVIKPRVAINALAYNHGEFIGATLDGIVEQAADFPFVAIVHDDNSTDNTTAILKEYAEKYPDIIMPIFEEENQYSKGNGQLNEIMRSALKATGAEYVAWCECDDYWTNESKLQLQIDFLDRNPEYGMTFHNVQNLDQGLQKLVDRKGNYPLDREVPPKDLILTGGGFCPTCSLVYRFGWLDDYPEFAFNYHITDYPLQIFFAIKGKVYYFNRVMGVYRYNNPASWTSLNSVTNIGEKNWMVKLENSIKFLENFDEFSNRKYHKVFEKRKKRNKYECYFQLKNYGKALRYIPLNWYEIYYYFASMMGMTHTLSRLKHSIIRKIHGE